MKWNAFIMAHNEEDAIEPIIGSIRDQESRPPEKIFVTNDGSTDSTGDVLGRIGGLEIKHIPAHPPHANKSNFWAERNALLQRAIKGVDYALSIDADTRIPDNYVEQITGRMIRDYTVLAWGTDQKYPSILFPESGLMVNADWARRNSVQMPATLLIARASISLERSAKYKDVGLSYTRTTGINYTPALWYWLGGFARSVGYSFQFIAFRSMREHSVDYLKGYIQGGVPKQEGAIRRWVKEWERDRMRRKLRMKEKMSEHTNAATYILPARFA